MFGSFSPFSPLSLALMMGSAVPKDTPESLALRKQRGDLFRNAIRQAVAGQPAPGQELGANLPTTTNMLKGGLRWLQQNADPNPQSYAMPAPAASQPPSAPLPQGAGAAGAPAVAATPSPSPLPPGAPGTPPSLGPLSAPLLNGSTGGWPAAGGAATPTFNPPLPPAARPTSFSPPDYYNGPGSSSFGSNDAPPGGIQALMGLMKGGTDAANVAQRSSGLIPRLAALLSNNGQAFAPGWKASNAWYNN